MPDGITRFKSRTCSNQTYPLTLRILKHGHPNEWKYKLPGINVKHHVLPPRSTILARLFVHCLRKRRCKCNYATFQHRRNLKSTTHRAGNFLPIYFEPQFPGAGRRARTRLRPRIRGVTARRCPLGALSANDETMVVYGTLDRAGCRGSVHLFMLEVKRLTPSIRRTRDHHRYSARIRIVQPSQEERPEPQRGSPQRPSIPLAFITINLSAY